ncbi:c-type cytochrome domain-containing protein [Endothiovibrio diazotrophicus]
MNKKNAMISVAAVAVVIGLTAGCGDKQMSYKGDVFPILEKNCLDCHVTPDGEGYKKSGLSLENYENLMKGTRLGPIIVPGSAASSTLNRLVEGKADPSIRMPHGGEWLSEPDRAILRAWVDQGAKNN